MKCRSERSSSSSSFIYSVHFMFLLYLHIHGFIYMFINVFHLFSCLLISLQAGIQQLN